MEFKDGIPVSMVSEPFEVSDKSTMAIEASSQQADLISMRSDATMRRIEEMLTRLIAERRAPPTPDPPDPTKTRQFNTQQPQPMNQICPGTQAKRFEFPKFDGTLLCEWISHCDQLFYLNRTPPELMVRQASLHFEGKALEWHLNYIRNKYGMYPSWPDYIIDISAQFGRNWDSDVRNRNRWAVGLSALNDETDFNVPPIDDLKEYGVAYTPMVIDDNQLLAKAFLGQVAHQVLDEMSAQNESKEIEQTEVIGHKQEVEELKESRELNQDEEVLQIEEEDEPIMIEDEPIAVKESSSLTAYQVFEKMSMLFDEEIELSGALSNDFEMSIEDTVGQETSPFSWDGLKGKLKIEEVAGSNIDGDKLDGHEGDICFDPGGDYQVVSKDAEIKLKRFLAGKSSIDSAVLLVLARGVGDVRVVTNDGDKPLCFDPGGEGLLFETNNELIVSKDELIAWFKSHLTCDLKGVEIVVSTHVRLIGILKMKSLYEGKERSWALLLGNDSHELGQVFVRRREWQCSHMQSSIKTYLFQAMWYRNAGNLLMSIGGDPSLYLLRMSLGNLGDSDSLKVVANIGKFTAETDANNSTHATFDGIEVSLLMVLRSQGVVDCVKSSTLNFGESLLVSKVHFLPIVTSNFIAPCLIANLKGDEGHCRIELLPYASTTATIEQSDFNPRGEYILMSLSMVCEWKESHATILASPQLCVNLSTGCSSLSTTLLVSLIVGACVEMWIFDPGGKGTLSDLVVSALKLYMVLRVQTSAHRFEKSILLLLILDPPMEMRKMGADLNVRTRVVKITSFVFDPGDICSKMFGNSLTCEKQTQLRFYFL